MVSAAFQRILPLFPNRINHHIFLGKIASCEKLGNIGIISSSQASVGGDDNHPFFAACAAVQIGVPDILRHSQNGLYRLIHGIEIWLGLLGFCFGLLQLDGRDQLHRFRYLLGTLDTSLPSFNVSHGSHTNSPVLSI